MLKWQFPGRAQAGASASTDISFSGDEQISETNNLSSRTSSILSLKTPSISVVMSKDSCDKPGQEEICPTKPATREVDIVPDVPEEPVEVDQAKKKTPVKKMTKIIIPKGAVLPFGGVDLFGRGNPFKHRREETVSDEEEEEAEQVEQDKCEEDEFPARITLYYKV